MVGRLIPSYFLVWLGGLLFFSIFIVDPGDVYDFQSFRQSQTLVSTVFMARHNEFSFVLPVAGNALLPFEFPVFQYLISLWGLDSDGNFNGLAILSRITSLLSTLVVVFLSSMFLFKLRSEFRFSTFQQNLTLALFLVVSVLCWGRVHVIFSSTAILIDSFAVMLAFLGLALAMLRSSSKAGLLFGASLICLSVFQKITTGLSYALVLGFWLLFLMADKRYSPGRPFVGAVMILCGSLAIAYVQYNEFSDLAKGETPLGMALTSSALWGWNFGALENRFSYDWWSHSINTVFPKGIFGFGIFVSASVYVFVSGSVFGVRQIWFVRGHVVIVCITLILFNQLYRHPYYSLAVIPSVATVLIGAGLLAIHNLRWVFERVSRKVRFSGVWVSHAVVGLLVFASAVWGIKLTERIEETKRFNSLGGVVQREAFSFVRQMDDVDFVLGWGLGWSSTLPLYSRKPSVMMSGLMLSHMKAFNETPSEDGRFSLAQILRANDIEAKRSVAVVDCGAHERDEFGKFVSGSLGKIVFESSDAGGSCRVYRTLTLPSPTIDVSKNG